MPLDAPFVKQRSELMIDYSTSNLGHYLIDVMVSSISKQLTLGLKPTYFHRLVSLGPLVEGSLDKKFGSGLSKYRISTAATLSQQNASLVCFRELIAGGNDWIGSVDWKSV
jgi:hypothetical protein